MTKNAEAGGDVRLPYEGNETTVEAAADSLFESLASEEETPEEENEPVAESEEDEAETGEDFDEEDGAEESDEDDEEAEEGEEEPDTQPETIKVKVDGEEVEVTLDELTKGYSRTADYTRKTQALAEQRKQIEQEAAAMREAREQYAGTLQALEQHLEQQKPAEPDWDKLRKENPAEFAAQWAEHQRVAQDLQAVRAEREKIEAQRGGEAQKQLESYLEAEKAKLFEHIPEWQDAEKAAPEKQALVEGGKREYGFSEEEFGQVYDHRLILILRDALRYRELKTKGTEQIAAKKQTAKVLKPGGRDNSPRKGKKSEHRAQMDKLVRSGRAEDAVDILMGVI